MPLVPNSISEKLGLPKDCEASALLEYSKAQRAYLDGLLATEEGLNSAFESLANSENYIIRVFPQAGQPRTNFCEVRISTHSPIYVGTFEGGDHESGTALPTKFENLILWGLLDPDLGLCQAWSDRPDGVVIDWREKLKGAAIVAIPKGLGSEGRVNEMLCAALALKHTSAAPVVLPTMGMVNASSIVFGADFSAYRSVQIQLLGEAIQEERQKWRFLALYKILENAYLENIKNVFLGDFAKDPKQAAANATRNLGSELNQLDILATSLNLTTEFEDFNAAFEAQLPGNTYLVAIDESARADRDYYGSQQIYKKGLVRYYKMRCSIAHGGTRSVIFEEFGDASLGVQGILDTAAALAFKTMRISHS